MTGPASGGSERGTGAPSRSTGTQGAVGALLVVLALGLALRLIIAYLLPGSGFEADLNAFRYWANDLATNGLSGFYGRDFFHDYTPGYLYVLWVVGLVGQLTGGVGDLIKIPPILSDLAVGYLVWSMIRELGGRDRLALIGAIVAVLNPISWFNSVVWGQVDSFGVIFVLLALRDLWRDRPERSAVWTVVAAIIKPQLGILIPLIAVVTIRRALWPVREATDAVAATVDGTEAGTADLAELADPAGADPEAAPTGAAADGGSSDAPSATSWLDRVRAWERRTDSPWRIVTTGLAGYLTAVLLCLPFGLSVIGFSPEPPFVESGLIDQVIVAGGGYPYLTVNAYNAWALVPGDTGISLASTGQWVCDVAQPDPDKCGAGIATFGPVPAVAVGSVLLVASLLVILWFAARSPDRLTLTVALAVLALAFFVVPTRVHERYGFPFFAIGAILFAVSSRWRLAYVVLSVATFLNMYVVLTTLYPDNPNVEDWLGIGGSIRDGTGVALVAILHTGAFVWTFLQLRADRRATLKREVAAAAAPIDDADDDTFVAGSPAGLPARSLAGSAALGSLATTDAAGRAPPAAPSGALALAVAPSATTVAMPSWSPRRSFAELGFVGWFRDRLDALPIRPDRSAKLVGERGGRLDRLDAWLLVVLVLASLGLRTFRLAEPLQMHFDEVYHARTAMEFLQDWRYGQSHDIYEWTHPHLAKYAMAAGIALWGEDDVSAVSDLGVPVRAAAMEPRREGLDGERAGERVHVATGDAVRTYDVRTRALVSEIAAPGASALAVDTTANLLVIGSDDGSVSTVDLDAVGLGGVDIGLTPEPLGNAGHPVTHLLVNDDGTSILAASDDRLTAFDADTGQVTGTVALPGIADLSPAGTGSTLVATPSAVEDHAAAAARLIQILGGTDADFLARLDATPDANGRVVLGLPGGGEVRTSLDKAITDGELPGVEVADVSRIAVATDDGVAFVDPVTVGVITKLALEGGAHGLAMAVGIDDPKLYVTTGTAADPSYETIAVGGDTAKAGPADTGNHPMPGLGSLVAWDDATQMVHILGHVPTVVNGGNPARQGDWTVYVVEPHANAVFADARLPPGMLPAAWAMDVEPQYAVDDPQQLLVFGEQGLTASIELGSHAFAWRLPGVIAGAVMAGVLYLLARILFRRRSVALLTGAFVLLDGMMFVQSRIGMNDVYVGLFIAAAYTVFAAVWTGWWRGRWAFWISMPIIGVLLGLALASKWVAAYAIGALLLLLLIRSALGRVLAIIGLIGTTTVLGYLAISVPEGQGFGNLTFLLVMIGLTLLATVVNVLHPIAWTDDEQWFALIAPAALGILVFFGALALGKLGHSYTIGSLSVTPLEIAILMALGSLVVYGVFHLAARFGFGPLAPPPGPDDPGALLEPPAPAPTGWLRPGHLAGLPIAWALGSLVAIPLVVYVISYIPWAMIEGHQLWPGVPPGHTGQTLIDLTRQMYDYHNSLSSPHPASSPWWAWPFDLKPVWFYQDSFANETTAAIYDAGNLVIWWLGVPAMIFAALMAYRRRSLALALITIGFATQWIPWARIDRPAFQYHYYTALPFVIMALAYLVAELWHGPSRRTWMVVRLAAAAAIVGPAAMWILSRPLCAFVGVQSVNPGSAACPAVIPDLTVTVRSIGLLVVLVVGAIVLGWAVRRLDLLSAQGEDGLDLDTPGRGRGEVIRTLLVPFVLVAIGFAVVALLPETEVFSLTGVPVEPIAVLVAIPLVYLGAQVIASRDARRFAIGLGLAVSAWFVVWYPNISALPLPSAFVNAYQGLIPTYLYAFQFPVRTGSRTVDAPLFSPTVAVLGLAITVTCLVVAYSAWIWRLALAESKAPAPTPDGSPPGDAASDGLARTGGGA